MPDLKFYVLYGDKEESVEAPSEMSASEFVKELDPNGDSVLEEKETGRELDTKLTLAQNGVRNGCHLIFKPKRVIPNSPPVAPQWTAPPTERIGISLVKASILMVIALLIGFVAGSSYGRRGVAGLESDLKDQKKQGAEKDTLISDLNQELRRLQNRVTELEVRRAGGPEPPPLRQLPGTPPVSPGGTSTTPAHSVPGKPVRVGGNVQQARLIRQVTPVYSPLARQARVTGAVVLEAVIARDGSVRDLRIITGQPLLNQAAIDAVKKWRYQPTLLNGESVEVVTTITVNFTLRQ
jgi:TonB family protein